MIGPINYFIVLFFVFFCILSSSDIYAYENLHVSHENMKKNIVQKYVSPSNTLIDGCTSFAPEHYHRITGYRYYDQFGPTFDAGFLKNEYPVTINSINFERSDFMTKSKTVELTANSPISITLLLFENRGPQNIQNVTMYLEHQNSSMQKNTTTSFSIILNDPEPVSDPIQYYIKGGIDEDFNQSYLYGNTWTNYSLKVNDSDNLFQNVAATVSKENHKLKVIFDLIPTHTLPKSDLIITSFDVKGNGMFCNVLDVWNFSNVDLDNTLFSEPLLEKKSEKTNLTLFDFKKSRFDGGQPIVFSGNLVKDDGTRIPNSLIYIKSDSSCTSDGIIATGLTDKYGKFWIYTMPKQWDPQDNLIKIHAEFLGDDNFSSSKSQERVISVSSSNAQEC